jgi:hypothetical protein
MFLEPFPSSSSLCWLYNSGVQQTCHSILRCEFCTGIKGKVVPLLVYLIKRQAMKTEGGNWSTVPPALTLEIDGDE